LSTKKSRSTLSGQGRDLARRISDVPMLKPSDVMPSDPNLDVVGVLNPTFFETQSGKYLIVRIDERPSVGTYPGNNRRRIQESLLVAYADVEYAGKMEIIETNIKGCALQDGDPFLPDTVRQYCFETLKQELLLSYVSHLRMFELTSTGVLSNAKPLVSPSSIFSKYGCEDARASVVEGKPMLTYTAIGPYGATSWLAEINNNSIVSNKMILGPDHKHSAIFPSKIKGAYCLLTRPLTRSYLRASGVWMLESPDMVHWGAPTPVLLPRHEMWDSVRVGPCGSPISIDSGWILFYYGVDPDNTYRLGAALLDHNNPSKIIGRTHDPILSPLLEWERRGRRADTVFSCGTEWLSNEDTFRIYYGAADTYIGAADISLRDILSELV
jgi:predicted GH43/DUF377 family glycosyl hydrolase